MPSFQTSLTPSKRAAGRFVASVRRAIQKALVEEATKNGINQSEIARRIGVHRSVICREIQGRADITLSRVAELAFALGRVAKIEFETRAPTMLTVHTPASATANVVRWPYGGVTYARVEATGEAA